VTARFVPPLICWDVIRGDKLYLQKPDSIIEISEVWPEPAARASTWRRPEWHICRPKIQLESRALPYDEFFCAVPAAIRSMLGRFPAWHWELLSGVAASTAVLELLQTNPALGLMSQVYWKFQETEKRSTEYAVTLATRRQREIAGALGFPAMNWAVRVLAKIPAECVHIRDLQIIRRLMNDAQTAKWMRHLERIDSALLSLLTYPHLRDAISWQLVQELASDHSEQASARTVMQLIELDEHRRRLRRPAGSPYRTVNGISDAWRALQETRPPPRQASKPVVKKFQFPVAPLPTDIGITPLLSHEAITREAEMQDNCVDSYIDAARKGQVYLFRMTFPERATLAVKRKYGQWRYTELKGPRNRPVRRATRAYVREWLTLANAGKSRTRPTSN
jgi:hypothetical protein